MTFIFDFRSYKKYLRAVCEEERGRLSRLSEAADCQKSYLSSCLRGKNNLTLDQAFGIAQYLKLSDHWQSYFFLMIDRERATTALLQKKLDVKIKEMAREAYRLKHHQINTAIVTETAQNFGAYYSGWLMTAIHTLTSVPRFQSVEQIAQRLGLSQEQVFRVLSDLVALGLVKNELKSYRWQSGNIHLPDSSPWISSHHTNWRMRAAQSIQATQRFESQDLHSTLIQSMSESDFELLKTKIIKFMKEFTAVSDPSDPEEAYCFNIDFFKV